MMAAATGDVLHIALEALAGRQTEQLIQAGRAGGREQQPAQRLPF